LLDAYGFQTFQCRDGAKAVEIARQEQPDLIIMDIQLPEVSGLDITRWLKDDDKVAHIPVLAVTAFAMRADEKRVREAGCEGYLSKPIQIATFIKAVEALMPKEAA
jgi:two-component system cell cycle response regulator DivK